MDYDNFINKITLRAVIYSHLKTMHARSDPLDTSFLQLIDSILKLKSELFLNWP